MGHRVAAHQRVERDECGGGNDRSHGARLSSTSRRFGLASIMRGSSASREEKKVFAAFISRNRLKRACLIVGALLLPVFALADSDAGHPSRRGGRRVPRRRRRRPRHQRPPSPGPLAQRDGADQRSDRAPAARDVRSRHSAFPRSRPSSRASSRTSGPAPRVYYVCLIWIFIRCSVSGNSDFPVTCAPSTTPDNAIPVSSTKSRRRTSTSAFTSRCRAAS